MIALSIVIGVKQQPSLVIGLVFVSEEIVEDMPGSRLGVLSGNNGDPYARQPEEIEILLGCESIVTGDEEETVVSQTCAVPVERPGLAPDETHLSVGSFGIRRSMPPRNGIAPKRPSR